MTAPFDALRFAISVEKVETPPHTTLTRPINGSLYTTREYDAESLEESFEIYAESELFPRPARVLNYWFDELAEAKLAEAKIHDLLVDGKCSVKYRPNAHEPNQFCLPFIETLSSVNGIIAPERVKMPPGMNMTEPLRVTLRMEYDPLECIVPQLNMQQYHIAIHSALFQTTLYAGDDLVAAQNTLQTTIAQIEAGLSSVMYGAAEHDFHGFSLKIRDRRFGPNGRTVDDIVHELPPLFS